MRSLACSALFLTVAAGCAVSRGTPDQALLPLDARIVQTASDFGLSRAYVVSTNRLAHVAIFEILPGRGVSLVYPGMFERGGAVVAGTRYALETPLNSGRWFYASSFIPAYVPRARFLFMIASEQPLRLERLASSAAGLRTLLGYRQFTALDPYLVMDQLAMEFIPVQHPDAYSTDVWVDWGSMRPLGDRAIRIVQCLNGRLLVVPAQYTFLGCPGDGIAMQASLAQATAAPPEREVRPRSGEPRDRGRPDDLYGTGSAGVRRNPVSSDVERSAGSSAATSAGSSVREQPVRSGGGHGAPPVRTVTEPAERP